MNRLSGPLRANPWVAAGTLCRRELVRFVRQRNRVFGALGQPLLFWVLFSEGFRGSAASGGPLGASGYLHFFPGTMVMILLFTAIFSTISIIEDRREGFLQSVLVAPVARWSMVLGKVWGGTLLALGQAGLFFVLGWFTLDIAGASLGESIVRFATVGLWLVVIGFALTSLGFVIAWQMDSTHGFHAVMSVFLLPMWLLSGAFFPAEPGLLGWVVALNPLSYGVSGLRLTLGMDVAPPRDAIWLCWGVTLLFAGIMFLMAVRVARKRTTGDLL